MITQELIDDNVSSSGKVDEKLRFTSKVDETKSATNKLKVDIAKAIGKHVSESGLTQVELAARTGMAPADVSNIVNGKVANRSLNLLLALADYLGILQKIEVTVASQAKAS